MQTIDKEEFMQPSLVFERKDEEGFYLLHHIILNSAPKMLKHSISSILNWEQVDDLILHTRFCSYRLSHLAVFGIGYSQF